MIACVEALIHRTEEGFELVRDETRMRELLGTAPALPYFVFLERWDDGGRIDDRTEKGPISERSRGLRAPFDAAD